MPDPQHDLSGEIEKNASRPHSARSDSGSTEGQPLRDLIAADEYLANKRASRKRSLGVFQVLPRTPNALGEMFDDRR